MSKGAGVLKFILLFAAFPVFVLSSANYHENLASDMIANQALKFYIVDSSTGARTEIKKSQVELTSTTLGITTGRLKFQKSPKSPDSLNPEVACVARWRLSDGTAGWLNVVPGSSSPVALGISQVSFETYNGCPEGTAEPIKLVDDQCSVYTPDDSAPITPPIELYTFETPRGPSALSVAKLDDFAADMASDDVYFQTSPTNTCLQDLWVSKRIMARNSLQCPTSLYEQGVMSWYTYKYNNGVGYERVFDPFSTTDIDFLSKSDVGLNDYMLHDSLMQAVDEQEFDAKAVKRLRDYLLDSELNGQFCEKTMCPKYYVAHATNPDLCVQTIKRVRINPVPKKIYLVYPSGGMPGVYEVPDLNEYFQSSNGTVSYEVQAESGLNVSLNGSSLTIEVVPDVAMTAAISANGKYPTSFKVIATETIVDDSPTPHYDFQSKKLALELSIDVDILSSIYGAKSREVYRCQALTQE